MIPEASMDRQAKHLYEFGPFSLDVEDRVLWRGKELVPLTPKTFDTLLALIENAGRILEKEELMKKVWPDAFVEEANLAVNVSSLRKVLGESADGRPYIETIPRRGYRFVARVRQAAKGGGGEAAQSAGGQAVAVTPAFSPVRAFERPGASGPEADLARSGQREPSASQPVRWVGRRQAAALLALAGLIAVVAIAYFAFSVKTVRFGLSAGPSRVAVLPFVNHRQDAETDYLCFSLADAVITRLFYVPSIIVRPSAYIDKYRGPDINVQQVAAELKVDKLVTASFYKEGDNLIITAQLFDVETDTVLWGETISLKYEKLPTVQDVVAGKIIEGLQVNLSLEESARLQRDKPEKPLAYEYFLQGVNLYQQNEFKLAIDMLEQSVAIDPNYALARAHLGRAYTANANFHFGGREQTEKAEAAYEKALELNPNQIEARIFMANLFTDTGRAEQAVLRLREALQTNPNHAEAHWELGYAYRFAGMLRESIAECERARQLDPNVKINSSAFNSYLYVGQYERFIESLPPTDEVAFIIFYRGFGRYHLKDWERAAKDLDRAYNLRPKQLYARIGKALSHQIARQPEQGIALLRGIEKEIVEQGVTDAEAIYKVAQAYAALGDKESALRVLRRSVELGFFCYPYFVNDPLLENIRKEGEYQTLMETARGRHEDFRQKFF